MINSLSPATMGNDATDEQSGGGLTLAEFTKFFNEIQLQPAWRAAADREMDYVDGNQLDSVILQKQAALGIPPAIENLMGPAVKAVTGFEAKTRTDWRVSPDGTGSEGEDVAKALNYKLNQAERSSGADTACSEAFRTQYAVGIGWVEVARESDPFLFSYRCTPIHRNEIWWDMKAKDRLMLTDARYMIRRRWTEKELAILKFEDKADLIERSCGHWTGPWELNLDGGTSTDLAQAWADERGWSIEEQEWRDTEHNRVCLFEVWYRRWESVTVFKMPDGRVMEYDQDNHLHVIAMASGSVKPEKAIVSRMYASIWMGPHKLSDQKSPYLHRHFPYQMFCGDKEDRTGVPVGAARGMMFLQDNINASISKIRWGMAAIRTERTKGAVDMTDEQFRQQIARVDADIILNAQHMEKAGAQFKVYRDFQLNEQQYKMLTDARAGIERQSISNAFQGKSGTATSGLQESTQVEQSTQALGSYMDNFKSARTGVGERLLSMIVQDMTGKAETVVIPKSPVRDEMLVKMNQPAEDAETGIQYLTNDVQRIRLKVALNDVPSTPSFRSQQLSALSEAFKAMPAQYQEVALPHLLALMDIPDREEIISDIKAAKDRSTPEQIEARIKQSVDDALIKSDHALRGRELDAKYNPDKMQAEVDKLVAERVKISVEAAFSAYQGGGQVAANPMIAPISDEILKQSGWRPPTPIGIDPNLPIPTIPAMAALPDQTGMVGQIPPVRENTSPGLPPVPQEPATGMTGIETPTFEDNLGAQP